MTGRDISPSDHQDKEVRKVLKKLVEQGWTLHKEGHWGRLYCDCGCSCVQVPGTPKNADRAARRIKQEAGRCPLPEDDPRRSLAGSRDEHAPSQE
ncbi:hypothetical protein HDA32_001129 [Spinactinospora alkalitolerans]|uniref:Uncharacterized protein n=1 Tax=Spinactinospora alkalitolerans TaxID=687207 RepID=A0A852TPU2_9ACTN|nr:hypothetical protein [Spinactinospora alkalitolerans]NYE46009.1 hypothetical protein [Spinactinospora alkalitolerans]